MNNLAATIQTSEILALPKNLVVVQGVTETVGVIQVEQNDFSEFLSKIQEGSPALFSILKDQSINLFTQLPNACYSTVRSVGPNASCFPILPKGGFITDERVGLQKIWNKFIIPGQGSLGKVAIHEYSGFSTDTEEDNAEKIALLQNRFSNLDWNLVDNMFKHFTGFGILNSVQALLYIYNSNQVTDPIEKECPDFFDFVEKRTAGIVTRDVLEFVIDLTQLDWRVRVLPEVAPPIVEVPLLGVGSNVAGLISPGPEIAGLLPKPMEAEKPQELNPIIRKEILGLIREGLSITDPKSRRASLINLGWSQLASKYGEYNYFEVLKQSLSEEEYSAFVKCLGPEERVKYMVADINSWIASGNRSGLPLSYYRNMYSFVSSLSPNETRLRAMTVRSIIEDNFPPEVARNLLNPHEWIPQDIVDYIRWKKYKITADKMREIFNSKRTTIIDAVKSVMSPEEFAHWTHVTSVENVSKAQIRKAEGFNDEMMRNMQKSFGRYVELIKDHFKNPETSDGYLPHAKIMFLETGTDSSKRKSYWQLDRYLRNSLTPEEYEFWKTESAITRRAVNILEGNKIPWQTLDQQERDRQILAARKKIMVYDTLDGNMSRYIFRELPEALGRALNSVPKTISTTNLALMIRLMEFGFKPNNEGRIQRNGNMEVDVTVDLGDGNPKHRRVDFLVYLDKEGKIIDTAQGAVKCLVLEPHFNLFDDDPEEYLRQRQIVARRITEETGVNTELWVMNTDEELLAMLDKYFSVDPNNGERVEPSQSYLHPSIEKNALNLRMIKEAYKKDPEGILGVLKEMSHRKKRRPPKEKN